MTRSFIEGVAQVARGVAQVARGSPPLFFKKNYFIIIKLFNNISRIMYAYDFVCDCVIT